MTTTELIKSFMSQASWGQLATDGRPYRGHKWLTVKQKNFLWSLAKKEDPSSIDYFENFTWQVDNYNVELSRPASNGCIQMKFTNMIGK